MNSLNYSYDHGELSNCQKEAIITLIEKKDNDNIHLMSDPKGNSFVFPRVLMFPETKSRETSGLEG